ncbi:cytochrome c oxidase subunit VIIa family protein, partial [Herbaspirillum rubrisubalbicans]|uniref:cytochrome c oxidase subunit VIIa family protein n=1 Tax=Herbaspirillum rubrisubalbicans TaxID=80842 RepID=UPI001C12E3A3
DKNQQAEQRAASDMRHLLSVPRLASRAFSTTVRQMKNKVPDKQKVFLEDNGLPVHIKGGSTDVLLYRLTMTITIAGTGFSGYWLLLACMPRRKP